MSIRMLLSASASNYLSTLQTVDILGDGSGKALYNFDGNVLDEGGTYNGTATNVTYGTGKYGQCAIIASGKIDLGTKVLMPHNGNYSVSCWVKRTDGIRNVLASRMNTATPYGDVIEWSSNNTIEITFATSASTQNVAATAALTKTAGTWCHVVWTVSRTTNQTLIYVDNVVISHGAITVPATGYDNNLNVLIGAFANTNLSVTVDQHRFFDRVLTASEGTALYNEI